MRLQSLLLKFGDRLLEVAAKKLRGLLILCGCGEGKKSKEWCELFRVDF